jgi:hypothetical protein
MHDPAALIAEAGLGGDERIERGVRFRIGETDVGRIARHIEQVISRGAIGVRVTLNDPRTGMIAVAVKLCGMSRGDRRSARWSSVPSTGAFCMMVGAVKPPSVMTSSVCDQE